MTTSHARLHFRSLRPRDLRQVARLERRLHRPQSHSGKRRLLEELRESAGSDPNLSYGLFDASRLVGVVLAYILPHSVQIEDEDADESAPEIIYLADLAVARGYRQHLGELMGRFVDRLHLHHPGLSIEAHSFEPEMRLWRFFSRASRDLGFELGAVETLEPHESGLKLYYVRWDPVPESRASADSLPVTSRIELGGQAYDMRTVRCMRHWERLATAWDALVARIPDANGFQSYAYQRAWWIEFGTERRLHILTFWRDGELCGIAPLQSCVWRSGWGVVCELSFIGSRWEVDRPILLFPPELQQAGELLWRAMDAEVTWDRFVAYEQRPDGPEIALANARSASGDVLQRITQDSVCPYLSLEGSFEAYFNRRSRKFRHRMRSLHRRLASQGSLTLERVVGHHATPAAFEAYLDVESRSWKAGTGAAVAHPSRLGFYRRLVDQLAPREALHILLLRLDERVIAATIALVFDGVYHSLQIAHDRSVGEYSPGTVLEYLELQDCFERGYREYDYLGGYLTNKQRWTATMRSTVSVELSRRSISAEIRNVYKVSVLPRVQAALARVHARSAVERAHGWVLDHLWARWFGAPR